MNLNLDKFKHYVEITVRYNDLDTLGHVNNATYLSYLEEARIGYMQKVTGFDKNSVDFQSVVARVNISYRRPVMFGENVRAYIRCSKIGSRSIDFETLIAVVEGDKVHLCAKSTVTLVSFDEKTGTSAPNNPDRVRIIRQFEGDL